jgi:NADPH:quinone reductase
VRDVKAIWIEENGGPEALRFTDRPDPSPAEGQLLVEVAAAGVNYRDVYERRGGYGTPAPTIVGIEGAGTVRAVGEGVEEFAPGDRVAWTNGPGSYAEQVLVSARAAVRIPDDLDEEIAAAALLQGMTAHYLASSTYPVQAGDWTVVHAGAGGVGLLLTQIVKLRGGNVVATTSTEEKAALAREAGADEVVDYAHFRGRVTELTGGEGAAAVYDGVGKDTFEASLGSLRVRGVLALYGQSSGPVAPIDPAVLARKGVFLTRPSLVHYTLTRDELLWRAGEVLAWIQSGELTIRIGGRYPLAEARRAHEDLEGRRTTGKLLLLPR